MSLSRLLESFAQQGPYSSLDPAQQQQAQQQYRNAGVGTAETAATMASGVPAALGGLAFGGAQLLGGADWPEANQNREQMQQAGTYSPRTTTGQAQQQNMGQAMAPAAQQVMAGWDKFATQPLQGMMGEERGEAASMFLGAGVMTLADLIGPVKSNALAKSGFNTAKLKLPKHMLDDADFDTMAKIYEEQGLPLSELQADLGQGQSQLLPGPDSPAPSGSKTISVPDSSTDAQNAFFRRDETGTPVGMKELESRPSKDMDMLVNPTQAEVSRWAGRDIESLRMMVNKDGNTYVWDAGAGTHDQAIAGLHRSGDMPFDRDAVAKHYSDDTFKPNQYQAQLSKLGKGPTDVGGNPSPGGAFGFPDDTSVVPAPLRGAGQLAPTGGSQPFAKVGEKGSRLLGEEGGYTMSPRGAQQKTGYTVAATPGQARFIEGQASPEQVRQHMEDNAQLRNETPNAYFGGWQNTDMGRSELELSNVLQSKNEALGLAEATGRRGAPTTPFAAGAQDSIFDNAAGARGDWDNAEISLQTPRAIQQAREVLEGKSLSEIPKNSQAKVERLVRLHEAMYKPGAEDELSRLFETGSDIADRTYGKGQDKWWAWGDEAEDMWTPEELKLRSHMAGFTSPGTGPAGNMTMAMRNARQLDLGMEPQGGMRPRGSKPSIEAYRDGTYYDKNPMDTNQKTGSMAYALQGYPDATVFDTERWGKYQPMMDTGKLSPKTGLPEIGRPEAYAMRDRIMRFSEAQGMDAGETSARQWLGLSPNAPDAGQRSWPDYHANYIDSIYKRSPGKFQEDYGFAKPKGMNREDAKRMLKNRELGNVDPKLLGIIGAGAVGGAGLFLGGDDEIEAQDGIDPIYNDLKDEDRLRNLRDKKDETMDIVDRMQSGR